jgi:hypothetical protein
MSVRTDLGDLALDYKDTVLARLKHAKDEEAKILQWGADHLQKAHELWADDKVTDAIFTDWIRTITLVRVPIQTANLAKIEAKKWVADLIGGIFQGLAILAGAI